MKKKLVCIMLTSSMALSNCMVPVSVMADDTADTTVSAAEPAVPELKVMEDVVTGSAATVTAASEDETKDPLVEDTDIESEDTVAVVAYANETDTNYVEIPCVDNSGEVPVEYTLTVKYDYPARSTALKYDYGYDGKNCAQITTISKDVVCNIEVPAYVTVTENDGTTETIPVVSIREAAFEGAKCTSVTLPKTVREIQDKAFNNCINLKDVKINAQLSSEVSDDLTEKNSTVTTTIGNSAFQGCTALENVYISGFSKMGDYLFSGCTSLKDVVFTTEGMIKVANGKVDKNGAEIEMTIGKNAFENCTSLETFNIPKNLKTIGAAAFINDTALKTVNIGPTLTTAFDYTHFDGCTSMENVNVNEENKSLSSINGYLYKGKKDAETALQYCPPKNATTELELPKTVTSIVKNAGYHNENLKKIKIDVNKGVAIGNSAFEGCKKLVTLETLSNVEGSIGTNAFKDCSNLGDLLLTGYGKGVGTSAFAFCTSIGTLEADGTVGTIGDNCFEGCTSLTDANLKDVGKYVTSDSQFKTYIFKDCNNLKSVILPDILTGISTGTFQNCTSLTNVEMAENLGSIASLAFDNCQSLKSINLSRFLVKIYKNAFIGCPLGDVEMTRSVLDIDKEAFVNCPSLRIGSPSESRSAQFAAENGIGHYDIVDDIKDEEFLLTLGTYIYGYRGGFESLTLTDPALKGYTFGIDSDIKGFQKNAAWINQPWAGSDCSMKNWLKSVDVGPCGEMRKSALSGSAVEYVNFGDVSVIGESACQNTKSLKEVVMSDNVVAIPKNCFNGCASLLAFKTPYYCATIGETAFKGCSSLNELSFSPRTDLIEKQAFENCTSLVDITLQHNTFLSENAFKGCKAIYRIIIPQTVNIAISNTPFVDTYDALVICAQNSKGEEYAKAFNDPVTYAELFKPKDASPYVDKYHYDIEIREFLEGVEYVIIKGKITIPEGVTVTRKGVKITESDSVVMDDELVITADNLPDATIYVNGTELKSGDTYVVKENEDVVISMTALEMGDADGDGTLNAADAAAILQKVLKSTYKLGIEDMVSDYERYVDVDNSGKVDAADAAMVLQKVLKSTFEFPANG